MLKSVTILLIHKNLLEVIKMKNLVKISCAFFVVFLIAGAALSQTMSETEYDKYLLNCMKDENIGIRTSAAQILGERRVQEAVEP